MVCAPDNQSVFAILCTYGMHADSALLPVAATGLALVFIILVAFAVHRLRRREEREARFLANSAAFYLTAFLSPLGWQTNLVATIPLQFFLLQRWHLSSHRRDKRLIAFGIALAAAADLLNHETVGRAVFQTLLHLRHYGIAALLAALIACATAWRSTEAYL
jgi:predicted permease